MHLALQKGSENAQSLPVEVVQGRGEEQQGADTPSPEAVSVRHALSESGDILGAVQECVNRIGYGQATVQRIQPEGLPRGFRTSPQKTDVEQVSHGAVA